MGRRRQQRKEIDVVIPCGPGYDRHLRECLESVRRQSHPPTAIVVIADGCPGAANVVARYPDVQLIEINARSVWEARRTGYEETESELLCFIDADDTIDSRYLKSAADLLARSKEASIAHSDTKRFGDDIVQISNYPDTITLQNLTRMNRIHAGAVVRREALWVADAFSIQGHRALWVI